MSHLLFLDYFDSDIAKDRRADNFQVCDGDVFVATYPRSGTNWMCYVLTQMYNNWGLVNYKDRTIVPMLDYYYRPQIKEGFLRVVTDTFLRTANELPAPRLVKTHISPQLMPSSMQGKHSKVIYVTRNVKDVCVSYFNVSLGFSALDEFCPELNWEGFPEQFITGKTEPGSWLQHVVAWHKYGLKDNVLHITFEDMKENLHDVIKKMADFLGRPLSEEDIQRVVEKSSIEKTRANAWKIMDFDEDQEFNTSEENQFFRKGKKGNWRNHLTVAESEMFDEIVKEELEKEGININYE
ncbi:sulfotransferase 1C2-like [Glandiceps talaboti]